MAKRDHCTGKVEEEISDSTELGVEDMEDGDGISDSTELGEEDMEDGDGISDSTELGEEDTEDGDEISDSTELGEEDIEDGDGTENTSFHLHVGRILTNDVAENLTMKMHKVKWEMSSDCMPSLKWVGIGEKPFKEPTGDLTQGIKQKLYAHWRDNCEMSQSSNHQSMKLRFFFSLCNSYQDVMHCNKKAFYLKGLAEDSTIVDAYLMHALNHVYWTRDIVTKNDSKLSKSGERVNDVLQGGRFLDHGFTRPKVLLLLPLASIALRIVKRLIQLTPIRNKANVEYMDRFLRGFGKEDSEEEEIQIVGNPKAHPTVKPADFQQLFGGNNNDHFMMGIKFTKRSIKLYNDFYSSDIIVASPLGLITKIGEAEHDKEKDVDYLSSIEILIIDHADVITMQNWSHVDTLAEKLNHTPAKQHGTDIMRIRQWYLDGHARFYRQTILLGSFVNPDINSFFNRHCLNYEGKVKSVVEYKGVLSKVPIQVRQVYEGFDATSGDEMDDPRLAYFSRKIFPQLMDSAEGGILIFVSSYFEFVMLRNFLKSQDASFCTLSEYKKPSGISRARLWFFERKRKIMLYTERAHFYHRYKIRGIQKLIIYSLPERKDFYTEVINMLEEPRSMACNVVFSCFDYLKLERIVGTSAAKRMVSSDKGVFVFC